MGATAANVRDNSTQMLPPPCCPPAEFSIWTREAGAGGLSIAVEGPSKAEIAFEDRKDGSCGVSYVVQEPGRCSQLGGDWATPAELISPGCLLADYGYGTPLTSHHSLSTPSPFSHSELSPDPVSLPGMRLGRGSLPLLTGLVPQVTMRSPSSSMMSTSQTAPLWYLWPPSQMTLAVSPSPASRSVPGMGSER